MSGSTIVRVSSDGYPVAESYTEVLARIRSALATGDPVVELTRGRTTPSERKMRILFFIDKIESIREES